MNSNKKETFTFKTNINCGGCVEKVTPFLNNSKNIAEWNVDTTNKDKILSVIPNGISRSEIVNLVQKAGFRVEILD